ncbi:MAG TPA: cysteine dioxygenase family protein [Thermoanaerobaculia bacterium]|nr:cysteine dioxygenase family protein [Thermoanaerobaculia bacterium]
MVPDVSRPTLDGGPPQYVSIDAFVEGIRAISEGVITKPIVSDYLQNNVVNPADFERFKHWEAERHTRNLIFRNEMIEIMLICWNIGNQTPLHTHNGQLGWMEMIEGKLKVENFRHLACNKPENQEVVGLDCLAGATSIQMAHIDDELVTPGGALNTVDKNHTIHRISNLPEWNERAVSVHIYSRPIDSCVVFDLDAQRCYRRDLKYDF